MQKFVWFLYYFFRCICCLSITLRFIICFTGIFFLFSERAALHFYRMCSLLTKAHDTFEVDSIQHILPLCNHKALMTELGCPRGVMVKAMACGIVLSEFVFQSRYYVHFRANTLGESYEPLYPTSYGLNSTTTVLLGEWGWH